MLDAATEELERLIDVLDLEATPGGTPSCESFYRTIRSTQN